MKTLFPSLLLACTLSFAQNPWGLDNELSSRTPTEEFAPDAEWTLTLYYAQGPLEYSLENVLTLPSLEKPDEAQEGEITAGLSYGLHEYLALGASVGMTYLDAGNSWSAAASVTPAYAWEGLEIEDESELSYDLDEESFAYTNTLALSYPLAEGSSFTLLAAAENEASRTLEDGSEWEDALDFGLAAESGAWSCALYYSPALLPDVEHGAKITLAHSL